MSKTWNYIELGSYTETDDPFPVPNIPDNRIPTP